MALRTAFGIVKTAIVCWFVDGAPSMGAAIAFYALFSLAPMLVLVIALAGLAFGEQEVRGELFGWLSGLVGARGAGAIADLLRSVGSRGSGTLAAVLGSALLLIAATAMFTELRSTRSGGSSRRRASGSGRWSSAGWSASWSSWR